MVLVSSLTYLRRTLLFVFCFSCCMEFRTLYSFPTRRSSDLKGLGRTREGFGKSMADLLVGAKEIDDEIFDEIDRKSTRLNSSHVAISYAVFCLKKKMEMQV